jgi:hypothetical protein
MYHLTILWLVISASCGVVGLIAGHRWGYHSGRFDERAAAHYATTRSKETL